MATCKKRATRRATSSCSEGRSPPRQRCYEQGRLTAAFSFSHSARCQKRLPMPMLNKVGSTLNLPTLVPLLLMSVPIWTFFTSALNSQPPPSAAMAPFASRFSSALISSQ